MKTCRASFRTRTPALVVVHLVASLALLAWPLAGRGAAAEVAAAANAEPASVDTRGRLEIRSADGDFRWRVDGRVHADMNWYQDHGGVDFGSGSQLRRARLGMNGTLWRHWEFKFQYDFTGSGRAGVQDAFMQYTGLARTTLTVGHFKEPLSLEVLIGANDVPFIERSLPSVLSPGRSLGLAANRLFGARMTGTLGLFGEGIAKLSDTDLATEGLDEGWAVTGRLVATPIRSERRLLHLGAAASYRRANDHGGTHVATPLRIRQRPEASVTSIRLIDTGDLADAESLETWGLEAAWICGPLSLQGEYLGMTIARGTPGFVDPAIAGFYVMASWLLTGETRRYDATSGTVRNPRVQRAAGLGGSGAWELLARYSRLDLTDQADSPGGVLGGREDNVTLGVTWYANDNLRFMVNYVRVLELERPGHAYDGVEPGIVLLRTQVIW